MSSGSTLFKNSSDLSIFPLEKLIKRPRKCEVFHVSYSMNNICSPDGDLLFEYLLNTSD